VPERESFNVTFDGRGWSERDVSGLEFDRCTFASCEMHKARIRACRIDECTFVGCVPISTTNVSTAKNTSADPPHWR